MSNTVLVTGASQGIGRATAELLCERGYTVHATYNSSAVQATELESAHAKLTFHQADFASRDGVDKLLSALKGVRLDGIVNNAGIFAADGFEEWDYLLWRTIFDVNLTAPLRIIMGLRDQINDGGSIVNVASLDGMVGSYTSMAYSASKAALINLTLSLGNNFGQRNIRVNCISPGWIETGMATPEWADAPEITPLRRNGKPEEVAKLIAYLLGDQASFVNGANIVIDGGYGNVDCLILQESKRVTTSAHETPGLAATPSSRKGS